MSKSAHDYEEYVYEDLLTALFDKEILEEALDNCRDTSYKSELVFKENTFVIIINHATKGKENNREISEEI